MATNDPDRDRWILLGKSDQQQAAARQATEQHRAMCADLAQWRAGMLDKARAHAAEARDCEARGDGTGAATAAWWAAGYMQTAEHLLIAMKWNRCDPTLYTTDPAQDRDGGTA